MKLRLTKDDKGFYVEENFGRKKFLRGWVSNWKPCRYFWYDPSVEYIRNMENILHYEMDSNMKEFIIPNKESAITYAKCLWFALSKEAKEMRKPPKNKRELVSNLEFYFDPNTGNLEVRELKEEKNETVRSND
jgi:hypothetical protein